MKKLTSLDLISLVLSIYIIITITVDTFVKLKPELSHLLHIIDYAICAFFFWEFWVRLFTAKNKWEYLKWGWLDLLSAIPMIDSFRTLRLIKIFKIIRFVRAARFLKYIIGITHGHKVVHIKTSLFLLFISLILFSSVAILQIEGTVENSNIKTAEDAIWWSVVTVSSVGYGDKYPVTTEGRLVGSLVIILGVGLFSTFSGYIASTFIKKNNKTKASTELEN